MAFPGSVPGELPVRDVVSEALLTAWEGDGSAEILNRMRVRGVRRLSVVDTEDALVGLRTVDDVTGVLAEVINKLAASSTGSVNAK